MPKPLQRVTPFLWFDHQAEEAAKFYVSIFKDSRITGAARYDDTGAKASGRPTGSVMTVAFELDGQPFTALNGGPHFKFTEAISLVVNCETQEEVDHCWEKCRRAAGKCGAGGSRTGSVCRGKSFRPSCPRCCRTRTPKNRNASWRRCSR